MRKTYILLLFLILLFQQSFSQDLVKIEKKAKKYFNKAYFEEAMPLINTLIKAKDKDPYINYMYGVSSIETGNPKPKKTIRSLRFAQSSKIDEEDLLYYIGRAEQESFHTKKAIKVFQKLLSTPDAKKDVKKLARESLLECQNAKDLYANAIQEIIWKKETNYHTFYKLYDFDKSKYGTILLVPDELSNSNSETDLAFIPPKKDIILFSRYDKSTKSKDLFRATISDRGEFGEPKRLIYFVNGEGDEEFPFLSYDQKTLYFTSTGHKSMGGQDVYKTTYSLSGDWSIPTKLGMKINSSFNDFAFFFLGDQNIAYFASNRFHSDGKISVYKVKLSERLSNNLNNIAYSSPKEILPKSTEHKETENSHQAISVKEKASKIIENKTNSNQVVDSAYAYIDVLSTKEKTLHQKEINTKNISYKQNEQSEIFYNKYINLCTKTYDQTDVKLLKTQKSNLSNYLEQAELAKYKSKTSNTLNTKIRKDRIKLHSAIENLKSIAGEMQFLFASNKTDELSKKHKTFKDQYSIADSIPNYTSETKALSTISESPSKEDLLSMGKFIDQKVKIIQIASEKHLLQNKRFQESNSSTNELLSLAVDTYYKLVNQEQDNSYLKDDIHSFMEQAFEKQTNEIEILKNSEPYNPSEEIAQTEEVEEEYEIANHENTDSNSWTKNQANEKDSLPEESKEFASSDIPESNAKSGSLTENQAKEENSQTKNLEENIEYVSNDIPESNDKSSSLTENQPKEQDILLEENQEFANNDILENNTNSDSLIENKESVSVDNTEENQSIANSDNLENEVEVSSSSEHQAEEILNKKATIDFITPNNEGIKYRIQLGVFSTTSDLSQFNNIPKISKKDLKDNENIKVFSGNYSDYNQAEEAKSALNTNFPDAFIVAFEEGIKIPLTQAFNKQKENYAVSNSSSSPTNDVETSTNYIPQQNQIVDNTYNTDVTQNDGKLFYLQIGTFSQPKISAQLYNISPLLYEVIPNGLFRYFTGPYTTQEAAESAVVEIRSKGARSAFIVAYENGEKIHLSENVNASLPQIENTNTNTSYIGVSYRVQIGAFSKLKSAIWITDMQQRTGATVKTVTLDNGIHVYTSGNFSSREEASYFKQSLIDKGFSGVFVATFKNGKKVYLK